AIGTVCKHLARIIGNGLWTGAAVIHIGWCHRDLRDQSRGRIGSGMGLEAITVARPLCLTQRPSPSISLAEAMIVASTRLPVLTVIDLAFRPAVTVSKRVRSKPCVSRARRKRTNAVRSGVASLLEKPQKRRNDARSPRASASLTSERSYQTASSNALNIASGGQAGSPLLAG